MLKLKRYNIDFLSQYIHHCGLLCFSIFLCECVLAHIWERLYERPAVAHVAGLLFVLIMVLTLLICYIYMSTLLRQLVCSHLFSCHFVLVALTSSFGCYLCFYSLLRNDNVTTSSFCFLFTTCHDASGLNGQSEQDGAFDNSLWEVLINLFLTWEPLWSPDWNYLIWAVVSDWPWVQ